jgi:hypothetical protein
MPATGRAEGWDIPRRSARIGKETAMTEAPKPRKPCKTTAARRAGYVAAIVFSLFWYWAVGRLVDWSWVPFITSDFPSVVPAIRVGIIVGVVANLAYLVRDPRWLRALGEAATSAVSAVVGVIVLREFPFAFSSHDWETLARVVIVIGIVCSMVAVVVNLVKFVISLFTGDDDGAPAPAPAPA